jgi:hypothetical protein
MAVFANLPYELRAVTVILQFLIDLHLLRCFPMLGRRASFKVLAVLGSVFYMLLRGNEPLMASDDAASVNAKLAELKSATEITLLVVPYPTEFNRHVDKIRLRNVACVYQFASDRGPTFDKVFDVLSHADIQYDDRPRSADLRVGIIFRRFGEVLSEFYSDDWGGQFKASGSWDGHQIVASADLPSLLRALPPGPRIPDDSICGVATRFLGR